MNPILLVAYESRYARCGGVTAVLNHLPAHLGTAAAATCAVITPYHFRSQDTTRLATRVIGQVTVALAGQRVPIAVHRYDERWPWYFVDAQAFTVPPELRVHLEDEHFFAGRRHPYDVGRTGAEQLAILRRDALVFGAAVAGALPLLEPAGAWSLLLQDWQAGTTALAMAGKVGAHRLCLTLHNSYDSGGVPDAELLRVGIDPGAVPGADGAAASTVLNRAWPVVHKPIFTVSEQFALDLTEDPFQRQVMADQLQHILAAPNLAGINNGPFAALAVPEDHLAAARRGDFRPLGEWKAQQKQKARAALAAFTPSGERVLWGDSAAFLARSQQRDAPWFVMAGRDDSRQKGYDVAAAAVHEFLQDPRHAGAAQFLFFPIPGDEDRAGLGFLRDLALRFPADVLVLPFIFVEGYQAALQGAAFGVMPSLYEPFGMANEFYLNGAIGIGRATGGLVQQIVPRRDVSSWSGAVQARAERWHGADAAPTGILFREPDDVPDLVEDWRRLNVVSYELEGPEHRVAVRLRIGVYRAMVDALRQALVDAVAIYRPAPEEKFLPMLVAGIEHTQRVFSWAKTAAEYVTHLQR